MGKPFFRLVSLNFSPNMPDFDCKICLTSRKNDNSPRSQLSTATSLIGSNKGAEVCPERLAGIFVGFYEPQPHPRIVGARPTHHFGQVTGRH
jgi:hypothetical protein